MRQLLKNTENWLASRNDTGLLLLRLFIGARLIYGVIDNIVSWEKMEEFSAFLTHHQFPFPLASAVISVYAQFICGLMVLLGFRIRIAAFVLIINFLVALIFVHFRIGDSVEGMTPALAMLFGCLALLFTGAGKWAFGGLKR